MDERSDNSILVTGGLGFIGQAVVKLLLREGYRVISLDQAPLNHPIPPSSAEGQGAPIRAVVCDIADTAQLQGIFESRKIAGIIHLAAILPTAAQRDPARATKVNVFGSLNLLELARRFEVPRLVFGSSLSVYGSGAADHVVSEHDRTAPQDLYGAAKLYVEQLGEIYRRTGLDFVSLRIGRVVGCGARSATSAWRSEIFELLDAKQATEIKLPYVGSERLLLVHVDDVARMLVTLLHAQRPGYSLYNAPCDAITVDDLKREVESLNANISVKLGEASAEGNPRLLDSNRFVQEFKFRADPIFERLKSERLVADKNTSS
jgi:nucleoside-diphosphate-sugar epimerase